MNSLSPPKARDKRRHRTDPPCPDLRWLLRGIYRVSSDPAAEPGDRDPWTAVLKGRHGEVYPFGRETLAVEVTDPRVARRLAGVLGGPTPHQRGEWFWSYVFPLARLGAVADIIAPPRVRRMSAAARKRLAAIGTGTQFGAAGTALNPLSERQDAAEPPETAAGPSEVCGTIAALT